MNLSAWLSLSFSLWVHAENNISNNTLVMVFDKNRQSNRQLLKLFHLENVSRTKHVELIREGFEKCSHMKWNVIGIKFN